MVTNQNMHLHKFSKDCEIQQDFGKEEEEKRVLTKESKTTSKKVP